MNFRSKRLFTIFILYPSKWNKIWSSFRCIQIIGRRPFLGPYFCPHFLSFILPKLEIKVAAGHRPLFPSSHVRLAHEPKKPHSFESIKMD